MRYFIFLGSKFTVHGDCSHEIKTFAPWKESYDKSRQNIKKQRHHFANKGLYSQSYVFFQESRTDVRAGLKIRLSTKNLCFRIVALGETLESPLDGKIKPVNPKGDQWA